MTRVLVLGDSGVGKSSFIHLVCDGHPLNHQPEWTVGCSVDLKIIGSDKHGEPCFVEFFDVGCHRNFESSRGIFYKDIDAIILVYDLSNLKSFANLRKFVAELRNYFQENQNRSSEQRTSSKGSIAGYPVLVVGNKLDLVPNISRLPDVHKTLGFDSVNVSSIKGTCDLIDMFLHELVHPASRNSLSSDISGHSSNRRSATINAVSFDLPTSMFNMFSSKKSEALLPTTRR